MIKASLSNILSTSTSLMATGSSLISLSSQMLSKTMMYIRGQKPTRGIDGFMLDVFKETIVDMTSEVTDYPLEENFKLQTHYSRNPVSISVTGVCSDIRVHNPNDSWGIESYLDDLTEMMEKLNMISQNLSLGSTAKECQKVVAYMKTIHTLYRKVKETYNTVMKMTKLFGLNFGQEELTSQQMAYDTLKDMWYKGKLLIIETPWETYKNCVIENLSFTQPEETNQQTMISIKFKQLTLVPNVVGLNKIGVKNEKTLNQLRAVEKAKNSQPSTDDKGKLKRESEKLKGTPAGDKAIADAHNIINNIKNDTDNTRVK